MTQTTGFRTDNIGSYIVKDPDSYLDYSIDWSDWLNSGDGILSSTWTIQAITDDANPITTDNNLTTTSSATVWLSGGTTGNNYRITNTITTAAGLTDERYFRIFIKDRTA